MEIFFSLILLLLWFFLVNLKDKYLELNLKGWGEMCLGIFLVFLGSLFEIGEGIPKIQNYLASGNMHWGDFTKIVLYVVGIILIIFSPVSWLPSILEGRSRLRQLKRKSAEMSSFLSELNGTINQIDRKQAASSFLDSALSIFCTELKTEAGAIFLFLKNSGEEELSLTYFLGLSLEAVDNLIGVKLSDIEIFSRSIRERQIETSGELLNSDRKLALSVKEQGFESCLCIPLFSGEENLGVIALFSPHRYYFKNPETEHLLEIASELSRRIQYLNKLEILEMMEQKLKNVSEKERFLKLIMECLTRNNAEEALCQIVKAGSEIFPLCECKVYLRQGDSIILKANSEPEVYEEEIDSFIEERFKKEFGGTEVISVTGELNPGLKKRGINKIVLVPLEKRKDYNGVIVFECKTINERFPSSELNFFESLAIQASEALRRIYTAEVLNYNENLLNTLLDSIEDIVTLHDKNQKVIRINKAGLKFLNLSEKEVLGRNCYEVLYQQNSPEACPCYLTLKEKKPSFQQVILTEVNSRKKGSLKVWTTPVFNNSGEVEMVVEYARFEETPAPVTSMDKDKREVPKEFFNNMNNILAGILGNAELLMFQAKRYKDFDNAIIGEQIKLIEELVIEGSKLIRKVKGETEKIPEIQQVLKKEIEVAGEKIVDEPLKILAIDDQKIIRDLLESILQGLGHRVIVSSSGNEGMELFLKDGYDLVITDLGMPGMSGWEVSREIKQIRKETPVVMITGWGVHFELDKIKEFGVDYLLPKPFKVEQLSRLIDQIKVEKLKR
ncbi:MAG: response regulator [candidate division Zixibacteria bacterium]|nr:response regulator [candidate division Zixibacteria bacterium]